MRNKILSILMVSVVLSQASEILWTDSGFKRLYQWDLKAATQDWGGATLSKSLKDYSEITPLYIDKNLPYQYVFDGAIKTNGANWYTYESIVKTNNSASVWKDSVVTRYTSFLTPSAIILDESSTIPINSKSPGESYTSLVRIMSNAQDTLNRGVVENPAGSGSFQIKGVYTGETKVRPSHFTLWHGLAFRYEGNTINILSQVTYGDSVKVRDVITKSLVGLAFDSLKIQMIGVEYITQSVTTPVLSITPELQNSAAFFTIQGRTAHIYTKNLNPAAVFRLYTQNGQLVRSWTFPEMINSQSILLKPEDFPAGAYLFKLNNGSHTFQTQGVLGN